MSQPFRNWAGTVTSHPATWARPGDVGALQDVIARTRDAHGHVHVVGSGHSWSACAAPHDVALQLDALDALVGFDDDAGTVTVEAGMRLADLNDLLADAGRALPVVGSIAVQRVAGVTATATHGSSLHVGNLSTCVQGVELVDGRGEIVRIDADDPRLPGVRCHLGMLGALTKLTLQTVPAFRLRERRQRLPFDEAADTLVERVRDHDFAKLWWLPHTDDALLFTYDRTDDPGERSQVGWVIDGLVNKTVFPALLALGGRFPSLTPTFNRLVHAVHFTASERVGRSDHMLTLVMPPVHRETELGVDVAHTAEALRAVRDLVHRDGRVLDFIVEARFVKADDVWMSPAHGRDSLQLGVYGAASPDLDALFAEVRDAFRPWDARPHWGKEASWAPGEVDALYPRAADFRALAAELDPDGLFHTPWTDSVLG